MFPDHATCYAALLARDRACDGRFYTGVRTTGIYCRPVCPARPPKPENCRFFLTAAEAVDAGFRACKRCRPDAAPGSPAWHGSAASVRRALALIDAGVPTGEMLGTKLGLGERQVRRLFARHIGAPPVVIAQAQRLAAALVLIDAAELPLGEAALASGFGSVRRFNEAFAALHGETPGARRRRNSAGSTMQLTLSEYTAPFATLLLVTDAEGALRALDFTDFEERMRRLLARHYSIVELTAGPAPGPLVDALDAYFGGDLTALDAVPVATGGSAFQRSVWAALRTIPPGRTTSYGALAAALGNPGASRAVGLANGTNPVGIVVPCHRVIGANGALTGYAGGVERKRWLLAHESRRSL